MNIDVTAILRFRGIWRLQTAGRGRTTRNTSVATLPTPWSATSTRVRMHVSDRKAVKKSVYEVPVDGAHIAEKAMDNENWKDVMPVIPVMHAMRIHFKT